ncbi:MAG: phospholipase D-like domain-containing protein, partial [Bryobacteraceae bacterium]
MGLTLKVYNNGDHTCLIWFPADGQPIPGCRGFGIRRIANGGAPQYLHNFIGFAQGEKPPAEPWQWPVQRFMWWDYSVQPNDVVRYAVVPVVGSNKSGTLKLAENLASALTPEITVTGQDSRALAAYFNRGIIATQWVSRELAAEAANQKKNKTTLMAVVQKPGDPLRNALSGMLRPEVLKLLQDAKTAGGSVFAALYELNDPELIKALSALGSKANLILANGAFKPPANDENAAIRAKLKSEHKVQVFDRLVSSGHFAHNKFLVVCDASGKAQKVLTGSTNWTASGLCTQANNGLIISDAAVADAYLQQWHRLQQAGNGFPATLVKANSAKKSFTVDSANLSLWFTPTDAAEDLQQARQLINQAKQGILFLFFNPGAFEEDPDRWTLLQTILNRHRQGNNPNLDANLY